SSSGEPQRDEASATPVMGSRSPQQRAVVVGLGIARQSLHAPLCVRQTTRGARVSVGTLVHRSGRSWVGARPAWRRCPAPPVWRGRAVQRAAASGSPCRARGRVVTSPSPRIQRIRSHGSRSAPMPKSKLVASPLAARLSAPFLALVLAALALSAPAEAQSRRLHQLLDEVTAEVEANRKLTQVMVDKIFSFSELGFQEYETSRYLVNLLRENGFEVQEGVAGIPTAWWATWGSGKPVIALGSDIDGIPKASQKPGVAYHDPLVEGAPGHGEGHNAGQAVNVTAALAVKKIMEREKIPGTLVLWPGVAEELVAGKAWFVRDGLFKDVDVVIFTHVGSNLGVSWGDASGTGLVSVEFTFTGEAAHSAGTPWRGRSALDAVELMNVGWNYRREHLRPEQRSHYVVTDGGDQPNVVPSRASVWYYIREISYPEIRRNFDIAIRIAEGAALMTDTKMTYRILGTAWPRHFNKVI